MRLLALLTLSIWSNAARATNPGVFTFLGENQCAPFEGILFDPTATANILTEIQTSRDECGIKLTYELGKQATEYELELQNLRIRNEALTQEYTASIESLERENVALSVALKKHSTRNPAVYIAIGVASGIAMSYGAYKVFNE